MEPLNKTLAGALKELTGSGIRRIAYMPYDMNVALAVVERIGKGLDSSFIITPEICEVYKELVRYFHGDTTFNGDLNKGIMLGGPTGTGKTFAMLIMSIYRTIDDTKYIRNNRLYRMNYDVVEVNRIINEFMTNSYDGIRIYTNRYVVCLDDIGTEAEQVKYYGNNLDVISYILAERYSKRLLTHATCNLPLKMLEEKYDDRIVSRMFSMFNFITLKGHDFRRPIKK